MSTEVIERSRDIRGVKVRWVDVLVAGHTVEQFLSYDVAEAEVVYGRPFDAEMDRNIQMGLFAKDRISLDGTIHRVASAFSYVLDGRFIRTAKIGHCKEIQPMSAGWRITRTDGSAVEPELWSCVRGTPALPHRGLTLEDSVTRFLRRVREKALDSLEEEVRPDKTSWWAGVFGKGHRFYHLWYSRAPWSQWRMAYRIDLHRYLTDGANTAPWHAEVGLTYLRDENDGLERWLKDIDAQGKPKSKSRGATDAGGRDGHGYGVLRVSLDSDDLNEGFAANLANRLVNLILKVTPLVDAFDLERRDREDDVTHFLRRVDDLLVAGLPSELKPDRDSGWADRSGDRRFSQFWYSREPWKRTGLSYGINLLPPDEVDELPQEQPGHLDSEEVSPDTQWEGSVDFSYWGCGDEILKDRLENLFIHEDQSTHLGVISVECRGDALDDSFAGVLAETAIRFIKVITPVLDNFEDENMAKGVDQ